MPGSARLAPEPFLGIAASIEKAALARRPKNCDIGGMGLVRMALMGAALALAGCQSTTPETHSALHFQSAPNSEERFQACAQSYGSSSKEFADCWTGSLYTKPEACSAGGDFLGDPWASDWQKLAMYETMRDAGCLN